MSEACAKARGERVHMSKELEEEEGYTQGYTNTTSEQSDSSPLLPWR